MICFPPIAAHAPAYSVSNRMPPERIFIAQIQRAVAVHFNVPLIEMKSCRRSRDVARPRQVAMYLAKRLTRASLPEIGRRFGNRDHTTVIHAVRQIEALRTEDEDFREAVDGLLDNLRDPA